MVLRVMAVLQVTAFSLPTWVVEHPVVRLELEEDSGAVLPLAGYLATCLAPLHLANAIINHILILLVDGAPQGSDHRRIGGRRDGVATAVHPAVKAAALAQELPLVVKRIRLVL